MFASLITVRRAGYNSAEVPRNNTRARMREKKAKKIDEGNLAGFCDTQFMPADPAVKANKRSIAPCIIIG